MTANLITMTIELTGFTIIDLIYEPLKVTNQLDLRGGQEGTGDTQTFIVWTTGGKDLGETLLSLRELPADLPYG